MVEEVFEEDFERDVLKANRLCVVDFYADWCGPCKILAPMFREVSKQYEDVGFYKVNVDDNRNLAYDYDVKSIPFLALFKNRELVDSSVGVISEDELKQIIERNR